MKIASFILACLGIFILVGEPLKAQNISSLHTLKLVGLNGRNFQFNEDSLKTYPKTEIIRKDKDGKEHSYSGVILSYLLAKIGVPQNGALRGKSLSQYLLVKAYDGYQVVFALPELDSDFSDSPVILANRVDGMPFIDTEGPFRIIVQKDKKPARCVRQVMELRILSSQ